MSEGAKPITQRQLEVLYFVWRTIETTGLAPSHREISAQFGISIGEASETHLRALIRKGFVARKSGKSRALVVTPKGRAMCLGHNGYLEPPRACSQCGLPTFHDKPCSACRHGELLSLIKEAHSA